ncbi:MAG: ATP-binding protein, partial [Pseudomonadota bacterium]
ILIGMDRLGAQIMENKRLARRITQWVKFEGVDLADARVLTDTVCEVGIAEDLLSHIHDQAKGNMGRMCTALAKVESMARTNQLESVTKKDWGNRELFYDQPEFSRRPR